MDPDASQRALECLRRIRQGDNEPFTAFLPWFERELIENDGTAWPDYFKIVTGRVACKQIVPKDEKRSIKEGREKEGI